MKARVGQRSSKQRRAILANLQDHPRFRSAQAIHDSLVEDEDGDAPSLATVYRNLQVLLEAAQIDAVRGQGGGMLYRACQATTHHHHLVCTVCGRAEEVELDGMEQAMQDLASEHNYRLLDHTLELLGTCEACGLAADEEAGSDANLGA